MTETPIKKYIEIPPKQLQDDADQRVNDKISSPCMGCDQNSTDSDCAMCESMAIKTTSPPISVVPDYPIQDMERVQSQQTSVIVPSGFAISKNYSKDEMILLRNVIAKDCTEPEFKLMMYMAHEYGLDPLLKQIWAVKRQPGTDKPAIIFVGRDGMLKIAHRSGQFDGMQSGVTYEGEGKDRKPVSAWCEIWRKDMSHSFKSEVLFSEYAQKFGAWLTYPSAMIIKVAEAVGLRKAFVVSGVYDPDEITERA
jgi:phage recombination protein Bet